jgi:hypothetical protein
MTELQKLQKALDAANAAYEEKEYSCDEDTDFTEELAAIHEAQNALCF